MKYKILKLENTVILQTANLKNFMSNLIITFHQIHKNGNLFLKTFLEIILWIIFWCNFFLCLVIKRDLCLSYKMRVLRIWVKYIYRIFSQKCN